MTHRSIFNDIESPEPRFEVSDIVQYDNYVVMVVNTAPKDAKSFTGVVLHVKSGYDVVGHIVSAKKADYKVFDGTLSFKKI